MTSARRLSAKSASSSPRVRVRATSARAARPESPTLSPTRLPSERKHRGKNRQAEARRDDVVSSSLCSLLLFLSPPFLFWFNPVGPTPSFFFFALFVPLEERVRDDCCVCVGGVEWVLWFKIGG